MANVNDGHRARLRERMMKEGLANFQEHEVLEFLLFQYLPRKDTNKLAHTLLNSFGGFAGVLNATPEQLMTVKGISKVTACNLSVLKEVFQLYKQSDSKKMNLGGLNSIATYAQSLIAESYVEKMVVVFVDASTNFIMREECTSNNPEQILMDTKRLVSTAMRVNAAGVIVFHCHVKGPCAPSDADVLFTEKLYLALASLNVVLLEHVIFNNNGEHYSFVLNGRMNAMADKYKQNVTI